MHDPTDGSNLKNSSAARARRAAEMSEGAMTAGPVRPPATLGSSETHPMADQIVRNMKYPPCDSRSSLHRCGDIGTGRAKTRVSCNRVSANYHWPYAASNVVCSGSGDAKLRSRTMKVIVGCVDVAGGYDQMPTVRLTSGDQLSTTAVLSPGYNFTEKGSRPVTAARISPL